MKSGFISLIGRPNAGKSTLLNQIIGSKIAITSSKPQTTRDNIQGIYNSEDTQMIFVDTPGIHKPKHNLGKYLNKEAYYSMHDVDLLLLVIDAKEKIGKGDIFVLEKLKEIKKTTILVINKVDAIKKEEILKIIDIYKDLYDFADIVPVSALTGDNIDLLLKILKTYLKDEIQYYGDKEVTNKPLSFRLKEVIREKILLLTEEEVPHSTGCIIESFEKRKNKYYIRALIIVDRPSLKYIIVGKNGSKIKEIGIKAREDIEQILNEKVYLELFVKVVKNWRDKQSSLIELGYNELGK